MYVQWMNIKVSIWKAGLYVATPSQSWLPPVHLKTVLPVLERGVPLSIWSGQSLGYSAV
jgi:hypothetical protein